MITRIFHAFVLLGLTGCLGSSIGDEFLAGSKRQDGLNNNSLYLWDRSPAIASGNPGILSSADLDSIIPKTLRYFADIQDVTTALRSDNLIMHYSHVDPSAPTFYRNAGKRLTWNNNPDFKAFFAYSELDNGIAYIDSLLGTYIKETTVNHFAWKKTVCTVSDPADPLYPQKTVDGNCASPSLLLRAPVLPLHVTVANAALPDGTASSATDTGFCPFLNTGSYTGTGSACVTRSSSTWKDDWQSGYLQREISFYGDYQATHLNFVDDGDAVIHELGHALQSALRPELLETDPGMNNHLDAIIEGSADFFSAAYRRSDQMFRYTVYNLYPLYPSDYAGSLTGRARDPANALYFPNAYSYSSPYDLGRVLAGAMDDYRLLLQGQSVPIMKLSTAIVPHSPALQSNEAWDRAVALLYQSFYELSASDVNITLNGFVGKMVTTCTAMTSLLCDPLVFKLVMQNRGLMTKRYFDPAIYASAGSAADTQELIPLSSSVEGTANDFLFQLGQSHMTGDKADQRWGLNMGLTLGWMPYLPGGALTYANADTVPNPCETIVVFPNITNNTQSDIWKDKSGTRSDPGTGFSPITGFITNFATVPVDKRGLEITDLKWAMAAIPGGFTNFVDPTLGNVDPYLGVNPADIRGVPNLLPSENTQTLIADQTTRLYQLHQEKAFDRPWSAKMVTDPANVKQLQSKAGWIFKLPAAGAATMTFTISYSVYNTHSVVKQSLINLFTPGLASGDPATLTASSTVSQTINVSTVDAGFCTTTN